MPKKKTTPTPTSTQIKKPEVLALKRKPPTPELESEIPNDASVAQTPESNLELIPISYEVALNKAVVM
jgi:hypothetical protein